MDRTEHLHQVDKPMNPTKRTMISSALLLAFAALPLAAQQQTLTLAGAVSRALANNPELAVDAPAREAVREEVSASRAAYRPRVDFEQSFAGGNNPVFVFGTLLTQRRFTAANFSIPSLNTPDPVKNLKTSIVGQQLLWDFGRSRDRVESARLGLDVADRNHEENVKQVLLRTLDAYYSVSLASSSLETARSSVAAAEAIVSQAQARVQSGLSVEADLLRGQVHRANARQQEIEARGRLEMARAALNRIMGAPLDAATGDTARLLPASFPLPSEELLLAEQKKNRPDYLRMLTEVRRAELEAGARRNSMLPVLDAFAGWELDNPSLSDYGGNNWTAGISFRWNIYAGGGDSAELEAARHRLEQNRRRLAAMETTLALEVRQALIQVRSTSQQVEAMQAAESQSTESLRILQNRYEAGLATLTDVLSAETARAAARTAVAQAIYRYRISYAQLEYAAGILSPTSTAMNQ